MSNAECCGGRRAPQAALTATAFQPTMNNKRHVFNPPHMAVLRRAPPGGCRRAGKVIAVDGSRGSWDVECPRGLRAVLEQSWRALLCREALGDPVPDRRPFAWFAWLQRAHVVSWCLFGFVGCTGHRLGMQRCRLWDCLVSLGPRS